MKNRLITLFILSIISVSYNSVNAQQKQSNETLETIHNRTSVRKYTTQEVEKATLIELVKAAMAAPTGKNVRPWEFIVVYGKDNLKKFGEGQNSRLAGMLSSASAAIVVCGNPDKTKKGSDLWIMDCSAASQNILLAAKSLGLGAVWTGVYPSKEKMAQVSKSLSLPSHLAPLCIIPIGYPEGEYTPKDKFEPAKIKFNSYTSTETLTD